MVQGFNKADGVKYGSIAGLPFPVFRCEARSATLTTRSCAAMFNAAQTAKGSEADRLAPCRSCPLGAAHVGVEVPYFGHLYDSAICPRCGNGTTRMIRSRLCVNCYNREREVLVGKNAKGSAPKKLKLRPVTIRYAVNGVARTFHSDHAVSVAEVCAHLMRTVPGKIIFTSVCPTIITATQGELDVAN